MTGTLADGSYNLYVVSDKQTAIPDGGAIPARFTCDGSDVSPPFAWSQVPEGARSLLEKVRTVAPGSAAERTAIRLLQALAEPVAAPAPSPVEEQ